MKFRILLGTKRSTAPAGQSLPPAKVLPVLPPPGDGGMKRFDASMAFSSKSKTASFTVIKDAEGNIIDYRDVKLAGYLSVFGTVSDLDRDGEYVVHGAFSESIKFYVGDRKLPMLEDHYNSVRYLAGSFDVLREDNKGLYVEASVSNAPGAIDTRFKIAEGHLQTLSIGGFFQFGQDGRAIEKVALFEGSLTPVPANPKAAFETRSLTAEERKKFYALRELFPAV